MKTKLILTMIFTLSITLLVGCYTTVKAETIEEGIAGISTVLDRIDPIEIKTALDYIWTTDKVNFRTEANIDSDIIETLDKRTKVEALMKTSSNSWIKVKYGEVIGYIYSDYLTDVEPFTSKNNRWGIELTDKEIDLLAKIVWTEARGESDDGEVGVIECIFNRMYSLDYPDSLYNVLSQEGHFASWRLRDNAEPNEREFEIIEEVLRGDTDILSMDVVYFSTSPRNDNVEIKIDHHYFCKED
jgi:hypothetical protein